MRNPKKSNLLKGFENADFRKAVFSYLKEKCPGTSLDTETSTVMGGLKIIREFILQKNGTGRPPIVPVPAR